jgi:hypothetical protein
MDCWHREIENANTEAEVATLASDYLSLWGPSELEPVTQGWRELRIETAADIDRMKGWITEGPATSATAEPLRELAGYFWHAAARILEIRRSRLQLVRSLH